MSMTEGSEISGSPSECPPGGFSRRSRITRSRMTKDTLIPGSSWCPHLHHVTEWWIPRYLPLSNWRENKAYQTVFLGLFVWKISCGVTALIMYQIEPHLPQTTTAKELWNKIIKFPKFIIIRWSVTLLCFPDLGSDSPNIPDVKSATTSGPTECMKTFLGTPILAVDLSRWDQSRILKSQ